MRQFDDPALYALICSHDPVQFDAFRAAVGVRLSSLCDAMRSFARQHAPDLEADDVVAETVAVMFSRLCDQFNGMDGSYQFNPALAPFDAYAIGTMGGMPERDGRPLRRGVIDTMRQKRRRSEARTVSCDTETLDQHAQWAKSGARWNRQFTMASPSDPAPGDLMAVLSPRERLVLWLEVLPDEHLPLPALRDILGKCGFTSDREAIIMERALETADAVVGPAYAAHLLGIGARQLRNVKTVALAKIMAKLSPPQREAAE